MSCNRAVGLTIVLLAALEAPACIRAHAKTTAELPLDMPKPPPRVVEANDPETPPPVPLPGEPVRTNPARVRPPTPRVEVPRAPADQQPKPPESAPAAPADVVKTPEEAPKPATPPATLQTTPTQREVEVERKVRTQLTQATNDLNRINYQALNADGRTQYDTVKGFVRQAEDALRAKNLPFASNLADKAAALAAQLGGR
jgi:hypothetical protein